jgi:glycosyltransferase 2 family protein
MVTLTRMEAPAQPARPPTRLERAGDLAARSASLRPSDPNLRRGLHAGIAIVLVLSVSLAIVAAMGDFPEIDWRLRPVALTIAVVGFATYLVFSAEVWRRLLGALGKRLGLLRGHAIWYASGLGRYVPTAVLLPMLRVAMCEREGCAKRICLASIAYEGALFFTASLIVAAYFVITLPDLQGVWQRYLVLALPVVGLAVLHPRIFHTVADRVLTRLGRAPLPLSLPARRVLEFVGFYAIVNLIAGLGVYGLALSVYPVGTEDLPTVVGSYAVANTLSILAFVIPGGLGAREVAMAAALSPVMPTGPALAIAVLSRIFQVALEVTFAVLAPVLARSVGHREQLAASPQRQRSLAVFQRFRPGSRDPSGRTAARSKS